MSKSKLFGAQELVKEFMSAAEQTINEKLNVKSNEDIALRAALILEEAIEFAEASIGKNEHFKPMVDAMVRSLGEIKAVASKKEYGDILPDVTEMFDAVVDIEYINLGTALTFGFPLDAGMEEVHSSNMSKTVDGKMIRDKKGKVIKPDTYRPANLAFVLKNA